jgi:hypothetical protein
MSDIPPVIRADGTVLDEAATKRQEIWESIGMPMSPMYMEQAEMDRTYRGRLTCVNRSVLEEAQRALKFIGCPKCVIERDYGEITVTRFHTRVQDDVMTVFKAMARNFCFNCGYEEYWPLSRDPRARPDDSEKHIQDLLRQQYMGLPNSPPFANGPGLGGLTGMGINPLLGGAVAGGNPLRMTASEQAALMREYQRQVAQKVSPPTRPRTATEVQQMQEAYERMRKSIP